jgi:ribosomal protein L37AE/L43A
MALERDAAMPEWILESTLRCPNCGNESTERMPTDAGHCGGC